MDSETDQQEELPAITIDITDTSSVELTSMTGYTLPYNYSMTGASSTVTIGAQGSTVNNYSYSSSPWVTASASSLGFHVTSDAEFDGDIKWKGRSLGEMLSTIEKRLAILTPDPKKLEHFEALQKAYQHYKTLEALCEVPTKKEEK